MLEEEFDKYANKYDLLDNKLNSKYKHSYRVKDYMVKYATMLGWSKEDIELAKIIGLLHDFGRFEQYRIYHDFEDKKTVDHADLSVKELFDKNEIVKFTDRKQDYDLIRFAIKNHNKHHIEECNDSRYIKFAELIRDADKVDIMYVLSKEIHDQATDEGYNDEIIKCIKEHKSVSRTLTKNINDRILVKFGFVFDIYNDIVLEDYKKFFIDYYKDIEYKNIFKEVYEEVIKYIDERIDNYARN